MSAPANPDQVEGQPLPHRRWTPLFFPTYASRVRFLIALTIMLLAAGTVYGTLALWSSYRLEAARAHDRMTMAVLEPVVAAPEEIREVLASLGEATRSVGQCDRDLAAARVRLPYAVRLGVTDRDGNVLCQTKEGPGGSLVGSAVVTRANSTRGFVAGDAPTPDMSRVLDFALPFVKNDQVTTIAFATVDVARFAAFRPASGHVLGLADSRGLNLLRVAKVTGSGEQLWSAAPAELVAAALSQKTGSVVATDSDGVSRRYVFRSLPGLDAGRLYAYAGTAMDSIFDAADRPALVTGLLAAALYVLVAALMMALGNVLIMGKTKNVVRALRRVLLGEIATDEMPRGLGELEEIVGLFVELTGKIDSTRSEVEVEVKNRTSALSLSKGITELEKARLEALLASIGEGVVATDREAKILFLNGPARAAMRWTADKLEGVAISDAFRLEDEKENLVERTAWPIIEAMRTGQTVRTPAPVKPFYLRRADRSRLPVRLTASPVMLGKEILGALVVFADITSEVEFDRRKSDFISIASHQLRSPSSAVKFMADMLRKGDLGTLTPKQQDWSDKLYLAADAMTDLVTELLNISRVETGVKFSFEPQDPKAVVIEATKLMEAAISRRGRSSSSRPPSWRRSLMTSSRSLRSSRTSSRTPASIRPPAASSP
jgi:PAS domain S-box-containing protein